MNRCPCMTGRLRVRMIVCLCASQRGYLSLQAKGGLGFFEPMSLPAAGTPKEQGANKRKSMDLGAQPSQDGELTQVCILSLCRTRCVMRMGQGAKRRRSIHIGLRCRLHGGLDICFSARLLTVLSGPPSSLSPCTHAKPHADRHGAFRCTMPS